MLSHKKKEGISVILMAKGFEWDQFAGPDRRVRVISHEIKSLVYLVTYDPDGQGLQIIVSFKPFCHKDDKKAFLFLVNNVTSWVSE